MIDQEETDTWIAEPATGSQTYWKVAGGLAILVGLYVTSRYSYLLFHSFAEVFSIVVACAIFLITWNSRQFLKNNYLLFIGIAYLFVAGFDLLHTLAYKGMGVFPVQGSNLAVQLWIASRYLEGISLLVAPLFLGRRIRPAAVITAFLLISAVILGSIFYWKIFPECYVEGIGLTAFKKISEYVICFILAAAMALLLKHREEFDEGVLRLVALSIIFTIFAELAFTFYISVYGLSNLIGHYFKIISFFLIYKAIIETGFRKPYDILLRELKREQNALREVNEELEQRVEERTWQLREANEQLSEDIAERMRAEQCMAEAYEFNEKILALSSVGITTYRSDGQCVSANDAIASVLGTTQGRLLNQNFRKIESWKQSSLLSDAEEVLSTGVGKQREVHIVTTFGKEVWTHCQLARFTFGGQPHLLLTMADLFELKQAEKELRASEKKYKELAELLPQLVYEVDGSGFITFLNAAGSEMTGYLREDVAKGLNIRDVFHPDDLDGLLRDFSSALKGEAPQGREYRIVRKDGGTILIVVYSSPVRKDHSIAGLRGVAVDISSRKEAEETIRQQSEFLRTVLESLTHPFYVVNTADYTVSMANSTARRLSSSGETTCYALSLGRSEPCNTLENPCPMGEVKATKKPATVEHVHYHKDGRASYEEVHAYPLFDSQGNVSQAIEYTLDITDRKRAEQALKSSEKRFRTLTESSPIGITIIQRGKRQYVNPAVVSMFGYESAEDVLRLEVEDLYDSQMGEMIKDLIETELEGIPAPYFQEGTGLKRSGEAFDISMWMVKTEFEGEPAVLTFVLDVSEEKSLRSQLFRAQKMESLGTMAGGIAHDFNNLLTIIQGYSDLLLASKTQRNPDYEDLRKILATAEKGADLVRRILTFSRKVESNRRPMDLNDEVRQSTKLLERTIPKMIAIELHLADDLKRVNADPGQIEQVLLNLAVNAQSAMPEGGTLTFETENVTLDEEYCRTHLESEPGEYVVLSVSDTGHGIRKDIQEHIFEPFYTTKETGEGTGLGLAVVYGIITGHGGRISCYSEPGHGATFKMYLPAIEKEGGSIEAAPEEMLRGGTESILLVDDEEDIRDLGARILSQAGYEVLTAETGQRALEVYRSKKEGISLVILDLVMPQMGGKECLQELLEIDPEAKVIIASGFSRNGVTNASVEGGAKEFVEKPYKVTQLLQTVRKVLDRGEEGGFEEERS